jgi:hypothetical protein
MRNSIFQNNDEKKSTKFRKNQQLDNLIKELKVLLEPVQIKKQDDFSINKYPLGFIIGAPRSGSTLLLQWGASLGVFSYPTNVLNRFAYAPYIGALIQKLLFDPKYDFSEEFSDINSSVEFASNLGKTQGALDTSEFQHFFRSYMNNFDPQYLTKEEINKVDFDGIKKGLASIEAAFEKPFIVKLVMLEFNLANVFSNIRNSIYLYIKREPLYNMQSLLIAREKYFNDRKIWWSVKPMEYEKLKEMDIYHQIAGQVYYSNKAIENALDSIPQKNKVIIQYEDFCKEPASFYYEIREKYKALGYILPEKYEGVSSFNNTNELKISKDEIKKFERAYQYFEKE